MSEFQCDLPLVSFVVLTYNHEDFIYDTFMGAISQDYPNIEIIISDDASSDNTYERLEKLYENCNSDIKKNVTINQNIRNMGLVPHLNYIMDKFVHGNIVFLAGGDDISISTRVSESVDIFNIYSTVMAVTGQSMYINKFGEIINSQPFSIKEGTYKLDDSYIKSSTFMCGGAGLAFRKSLWDTFGPLLPSCPTEDSTLRFRALLLGEIYVSSKKIIKYRKHENNLSRPDNIFKLTTSGIVKQYKTDLLKAETCNLITNKVSRRLKMKIYLYKIERLLLMKKSTINKFIKVIYLIPQKVIHFFFKYI